MAFDELMAEVDARADWDETKKQRIRRLIGSKQRNERTFQRCLKKGQRVVAEIASNHFDGRIVKSFPYRWQNIFI